MTFENRDDGMNVYEKEVMYSRLSAVLGMKEVKEKVKKSENKRLLGDADSALDQYVFDVQENGLNLTYYTKDNVDQFEEIKLSEVFVK